MPVVALGDTSKHRRNTSVVITSGPIFNKRGHTVCDHRDSNRPERGRKGTNSERDERHSTTFAAQCPLPRFNTRWLL